MIHIQLLDGCFTATSIQTPIYLLQSSVSNNCSDANYNMGFQEGQVHDGNPELLKKKMSRHIYNLLCNVRKY